MRAGGDPFLHEPQALSEWPWLPICVTTLYLRAASVSAAPPDRARQRLLHVDVLASCIAAIATMAWL